jgi:hypothetical protein
MRKKPPSGLPNINSGQPWSAMDLADLEELVTDRVPNHSRPCTTFDELLALRMTSVAQVVSKDVYFSWEFMSLSAWSAPSITLKVSECARTKAVR